MTQMVMADVELGDRVLRGVGGVVGGGDLGDGLEAARASGRRRSLRDLGPSIRHRRRLAGRRWSGRWA